MITVDAILNNINEYLGRTIELTGWILSWQGKMIVVVPQYDSNPENGILFGDENSYFYFLENIPKLMGVNIFQDKVSATGSIGLTKRIKTGVHLVNPTMAKVIRKYKDEEKTFLIDFADPIPKRKTSFAEEEIAEVERKMMEEFKNR